MEKVYIIVIEVNNDLNTSSTQNDIFLLLSAEGYTVRITEHSYLIKTADKATKIRDILTHSEINFERIFITQVLVPTAWRNTICDNEDIKDIL